MTYGHEERNLALIRQLEAESRQLLENLEQPDAGHRTGAESAALPVGPAKFTADEGNGLSDRLCQLSVNDAAACWPNRAALYTAQKRVMPRDRKGIALI